MAEHVPDTDGASGTDVKFKPDTSVRHKQEQETGPWLSISQQLNNDLSDFLSDVSKSTETLDLKPSFFRTEDEAISNVHVDSNEIEGHHRNADFPHITFGMAVIHHGRRHHKHRKLSTNAGTRGAPLERTRSSGVSSSTFPGSPTAVSAKPTRRATFHDGGVKKSTTGSEESTPTVGFYVGSDPSISDVSDVEVDVESPNTEKYQPQLMLSGHLSHQHGELGSEIKLAADLHVIKDETNLGDAEVDDITSHRFAPFKGLRHRKVKKKSSNLSIVPPWKKKFDHSSHEMFVELDELNIQKHDDYMWQERARWIKFEEDFEEGSHRWGKPHVACLSFHSLLELRKCLEDGVVLLDLEASDLPSIANAVVDNCVFSDLLDPSQKDKILSALLLKHRHVGERSFKKNLSYLDLHSKDSHHWNGESRRLLRKRNRSASHSDFYDIEKSSKCNSTEKVPKTLENTFQDDIERLKEDKRILDERTSPNAQMLPVIADSQHEKGLKPNDKHVRIELSHLDEEEYKSTGTLSRLRHNESSIFKRIPKGAEATSVLVGDLDYLDKPLMAFVRLSEGQLLSNLTEVPVPVRFMFLVMGPSSAKLDYYEIGRSISTLMADPEFSHMAYHAEGRKNLLDAINQFLDDSIVLPPGNLDKETLLPILDMAHDKLERKHQKKKAALEQKAPGRPEDDPLKRTKRLFGGLVRDVKRRYAIYLSDIKDGLNVQCLATFFFIYFACLSPAITFGGLMGESTDKYIGVSEMLIMVCISGILMALLSGQPLVIVGATGPLLVFEENFYQICQSIDLEYLPFRFWVGIWITIIAILVVMLEGVFIIKYITRFLQEIFSALISLIFIYEVFRKLYYIFRDHPLVAYYPPPVTISPLIDINDSYFRDQLYNLTLFTLPIETNSSLVSNVTHLPYDPTKNQPNTALLALILTFGTFLIAYALKVFRNGKFLGRPIRRAIGDFGIPIAIVMMVLVDYLIKDTYTDKLDVPDGFTPTAPQKRGWVVNPLGDKRPLPVWAYFAALIPALLVSILIFMETLITSLIINKPEKKLKKGSGYHLDLFLVGLFASLSGIFGLPLLCVATVRSVTHVSALMVYSRTHAPGEKPKLIEVKEQRLTGLMVHIMIGISVLLGPVLRQVPLAVLFGVFLYMGVASISGIQLFERIELLFMPVKHHPPVSFVRKVRTLKMHLYTMIQILCLAVLWAIKSTQAALSFPFFLILLIPIRLKLLAFIFNKNELKYLDGDEEAELEEDEPDFCVQAMMPM